LADKPPVFFTDMANVASFVLIGRTIPFDQRLQFNDSSIRLQ
jgi:hypothetical protein